MTGPCQALGYHLVTKKGLRAAPLPQPGMEGCPRGHTQGWQLALGQQAGTGRLQGHSSSLGTEAWGREVAQGRDTG